MSCSGFATIHLKRKKKKKTDKQTEVRGVWGVRNNQPTSPPFLVGLKWDIFPVLRVFWHGGIYSSKEPEIVSLYNLLRQIYAWFSS